MRTWTDLAKSAREFQGAALTIGNFDGLHLGHQLLFKTLRECPGAKVVLTFDPHPLQVVAPQTPLLRIFPRQDLVEQLPQHGVDLLLVLPFTPEMARTSSQEFWQNFVVTPFAPRSIVTGQDFRFGSSRDGSLDFIRQWSAAHGADLKVVEPLRLGGEIISSRLIRDLIRSGKVEEAARRLGRNFYLAGEIAAGAGRGTQLGSPTLNMVGVTEIIPQNGVYATFAHLEGQRLLSVTNIGINPTFGGTEGLKIETHLIAEHLKSAPNFIKVEFVRFLRPEIKFATTQDLKNQIKSDILKANEALDKSKPHD